MSELRYLDPSSTQTLREAIFELKETEWPDGDAAEKVSPDLLEAIDVHDAIHVLFGCPTDLRGEIAAHVWTAFGTTMSFAEMHAVNRHRDHRQVLREIGHRKLILRWLSTAPLILSIAVRARRMTQKWPADKYEAFLDLRLVDLRNEFGIRVLAPNRTVRSRGAALRHVRRLHP